MPHSDEVSQAVLNGKKFMQDRRTVLILGISPGNSHYHGMDNLERLFDFAKRNSDKVLLIIPGKISEHNFRAVGSKKPEKSARRQVKQLRNKCNKAIKSSGLCDTSHSYINWIEEVETCPKYHEAYEYIQELYQADEEFRTEARESTETALAGLKNGREKSGKEGFNKDSDPGKLDLEEGGKYLLKELAFFVALPSIYQSYQEFVFVYHRSWPMLEKFLGGHYDGIVRPAVGFAVFE